MSDDIDVTGIDDSETVCIASVHIHNATPKGPLNALLDTWEARGVNDQLLIELQETVSEGKLVVFDSKSEMVEYIEEKQEDAEEQMGGR